MHEPGAMDQGFLKDRLMGNLLFDDGHHRVLMFSDLVADDDGEAVQANQFLIVHGDSGIILDPGGVMSYNQLYLEISHYFPPKKLGAIFASHADPDIVASLSRWLTNSDTKLIISRLWSRFVPHFCPAGKTEGRIVPIDDRGVWLTIGGAEYGIMPAHFLHAEGNFQLYDPISHILFSGDLGASIVTSADAGIPVADFDAHVPRMAGFHRRYMVSNKVCRLWARMIRALDIQAIVPQHGSPFLDPAMIPRFIDWVEHLECGVDVMDESIYTIPDQHDSLERMRVV